LGGKRSYLNEAPSREKNWPRAGKNLPPQRPHKQKKMTLVGPRGRGQLLRRDVRTWANNERKIHLQKVCDQGIASLIAWNLDEEKE